MPKASDLKRGDVVEINDDAYLIKQIDVRSPSSRGASTLYKMRFTHIESGRKWEQTFKGDEFVKSTELIRRSAQFLYFAEPSYTFMDLEDYTQYDIGEDDLEGQSQWLTDGLENITLMIIDEKVVAIELPTSVALEIVETAPGIKGASAASRTKTARLSSGAEVQVPEYLEQGEVIKINTGTGKYMSRAN
ncbi:MAG: elongation factor P-like protein YeiP [Gammaproteobacteria bacterium]|nr:MAG: elongation factor P-like protein YeiP [Gammaproteobacteria bacterium]